MFLCIFFQFLGTFTISNLGMFGVSQFDAILPPGTGSILAIAASTPKVVMLPNGYMGVQKSMTVTITCDHRHIYGADAAEFLRDLAGNFFFIILCLLFFFHVSFLNFFFIILSFLHFFIYLLLFFYSFFQFF